MTTITLTGRKLRDDGVLASGFSDNKNYLVTLSRVPTASYDMALIYPKQVAASAISAFKWGDTKTPYQCRPTWIGGRPPYKATLFGAPVGATFGGVEFTGDPIVNEYTRTLDETTGLYVHTLPDDFCLCAYQFESEDIGETFDWGVMIQDQDNKILTIHWTNGVSDTNVKYFDSASGNNANSGTFESPYQTAAYGYGLSSANDYIFKFKNGTYSIDADFSIGAADSKSWIGVGSSVYFNMATGLFSNGVDDLTFSRIRFTGAKSAAVNAYNCKWNLVDRCTYYDCEFENSSYGTTGDDNPAAIAFWGNASEEHNDISIVNCNQLAGAECQMLVTFDVNRIIVENCHVSGVSYPSSNGSKFLHLKDETSYFDVRHCTASGTSVVGLFDISNQGPAQCNNQLVRYCAADNCGAGAASGAYIWNDSGTGNPCKGTEQYCQRNTVIANAQIPLWFRTLGTGGESVNIEGILYYSTNPTFIEGGVDAGVVIAGTPSLVAAGEINSDFSYDNSIKSANLGVNGHIIASELVI